MDDFMRQDCIDKPRTARFWTWEDASKMANFLTLHYQRSNKYGLNIPIQCNPLMTKEELKTREDELTQYFLYEMRKPAK